MTIMPSATDMMAATLADGHPALQPAFYPHLSEQNASETPAGLERLEHHATQVYETYRLGRDPFEAPFLLDISTATPDAQP